MVEAKLINLCKSHEDILLRHSITWRQLGLFWNLIVLNENEKFEDKNNFSHFCSVVISGADKRYEEKLNEILPIYPSILFLRGVSLKRNSNKWCLSEITIQKQKEFFRYHLEIDTSYSRELEIPNSIIIDGPSPDFTLTINGNPNCQVLLKLNGKPIVSIYHNHLFVGIDPWQLGAPSIPMLYAIIQKWLTSVLNLKIPIFKPIAVIRFDDLPTTAQEYRNIKNVKDDIKKSRAIQRIRQFAVKKKIKFNLMYTSHFRNQDSEIRRISSEMPLSIREIKEGVNQGLFEIGNHGMIHDNEKDRAYPNDPREFANLNESETRRHLIECENEIKELFQSSSLSFVAPAWGYRPGITKKIASEITPLIIDSSQNLEKNQCDVFGSKGNDGKYINIIETFRPCKSMLSYSNSDFWKYYAKAGIPVCYMQHRENNYFLFNYFFTNLFENDKLNRSVLRKMIYKIEMNQEVPLPFRTIILFFLYLFLLIKQKINIFQYFEFFLKILTKSSIYSISDALLKAGYDFIFLSEIVSNNKYRSFFNL